MRRAAALALAALLAACGDSSGPDEPRFPAVAGTYTLSGSFDAVDVSFSGPLVLTQADRNSGALTGTATLAVIGDLEGSVSGLSAASITEAGDITFRVGTSTGTATWTFQGRLSGTTISGRHTLADEGVAFGGPWGATKQ